jgi:hypothetical protein
MTRTAEIEIEMLATYDQDAQPLDYLFQDPEYREEGPFPTVVSPAAIWGQVRMGMRLSMSSS